MIIVPDVYIGYYQCHKKRGNSMEDFIHYIAQNMSTILEYILFIVAVLLYNRKVNRLKGDINGIVTGNAKFFETQEEDFAKLKEKYIEALDEIDALKKELDERKQTTSNKKNLELTQECFRRIEKLEHKFQEFTENGNSCHENHGNFHVNIQIDGNSE